MHSPAPSPVPFRIKEEHANPKPGSATPALRRFQFVPADLFALYAYRGRNFMSIRAIRDEISAHTDTGVPLLIDMDVTALS